MAVSAAESVNLTKAIARLAARARDCRLCEHELPHEPRPVFRVEHAAPIIIIGQAPGRRVHETGVPWNDASGRLLREWLGVSDADFYEPTKFAILPTGLCYPGTVRGKGDLPPLPRCAPEWHPRFLKLLNPTLHFRVLIGAYAIAHHLPDHARRPVSDVVAEYEQFAAGGVIPLPHPSPRNRRFLRERPWFERELLPWLRPIIAKILAETANSPRIS
ncbi:MAG: uracil-DNA glycosylase family protein [Planctomycetes bacterium]|nr:uracil-DNA glycosylase family protein [Planctomycetota bacterium]